MIHLVGSTIKLKELFGRIQSHFCSETNQNNRDKRFREKFYDKVIEILVILFGIPYSITLAGSAIK